MLPSNRLVSLDVFRGLIIAAMILVTDPGTYSAVYWPLLHAQWNGATPTDMIFPSFLVIAGMATTLSFAARIERGSSRKQLLLHALRRSGLIFFLGLLLNGFPDYHLQTIRIPGILQRIALCYLTGALMYLGFSKPEWRFMRIGVIGLTAVGILAFYWALLRLYPVPGFGPGRLDSLGNIAAYADRAVIGVPHMWPWGLTPGVGVTFDPEGLLSTLPAFATLLLGVLAGEWLRTDYPRVRKVVVLAAAGVCLIILGLALNPLLPIIKKIWTSTFALFSGGVALLIFSGLYAVLDIRQWRRWIGPPLVFGTNAIVAFALSTVITVMTDRLHVTAFDGTTLTLHRWAYQEGFATWLQPVHASLAYAILIVLINLLVIYPLYRKRVFLRI